MQAVLALLAQLVSVRINYTVLDQDMAFLGFLIRVSKSGPHLSGCMCAWYG